VKVDFMDEVQMRLVERDPNNANEVIFDQTRTRKELRMDANQYFYGTGDGSKYKVHYTIEMDPIPTVRVHAIKCEKQSLGCDPEIITQIFNSAELIMYTTAQALQQIGNLRMEACGYALEAASKCMDQLGEVTKWFLVICEGQDDVYMMHRLDMDQEVHPTNGFFPTQGPDMPIKKMRRDDIVYFEEHLSNDPTRDYYRFPLDTEDVRIELREHDPLKADISVGSIILKHGTVEEGDWRWNKALCEVACIYTEDDGKDGQGAVYHICYSVGYDDWAKPATFKEQEIEGYNPDYAPS